MSKEPVKKYNNIVEEAERLGVKPSWVYNKAKDGEIPCAKIGKYYFFNPQKVDAWIESRSS